MSRGNKKRWVIGGDQRPGARPVRPVLRLRRAAVLLAGAILVALGSVASEIAGVQLQRDARSGLDPAHDRPRQRTRLGPRLYRRHPRARARGRAQCVRLVRPRRLGRPRLPADRGRRRGLDVVFALPFVVQRARDAGTRRPAQGRLLRAATAVLVARHRGALPHPPLDVLVPDRERGVPRRAGGRIRLRRRAGRGVVRVLSPTR